MDKGEIKMIDDIKVQAYKRGFSDGYCKAMMEKNKPGVVKPLFQ